MHHCDFLKKKNAFVKKNYKVKSITIKQQHDQLKKNPQFNTFSPFYEGIVEEMEERDFFRKFVKNKP